MRAIQSCAPLPATPARLLPGWSPPTAHLCCFRPGGWQHARRTWRRRNAGSPTRRRFLARRWRVPALHAVEGAQHFHAVDTATHCCPHRSRWLCPTHTLPYRPPVPLFLCLVRRRALTWRTASVALLDTQSCSKTPGGASGCPQMRTCHSE